MTNTAAALLKLPAAATATKYSRRRKSMMGSLMNLMSELGRVLKEVR